MEKINELDKIPKDPNSSESQEFLKKLHGDLVEIGEEFRQWMKDNGIWEKYEAERNRKNR